MTYVVAIAICLATTPVQLCGEKSSVAYIVAPEHPASLDGCMRHGMLYAAESHLAGVGSYVKVFCQGR